MRRFVSVGLACVIVACVGDSTTPNDGGTDATIDSGADVDAADVDAADAGPPCDLSKPFGTPVNIAELNTSADESNSRLTADELAVYFDRGATGADQIYTANRGTKSGAFGATSKVNLDVNGNDFLTPFVTPDGGALYFGSSYPDAGTVGAYDIFVATPPSALTFADVPNINSNGVDHSPWILADFSAIFFTSSRAGSLGLDDIWSAPIVSGNFGTPSLVPNVNSTQYDNVPMLTGDGLTLYFSSKRTGTNDIYVTTRASVSGNFAPPTALGELNTADDEGPAWISSNGCTLYFHSNHAYPGAKGGFDLYRSSKP
jgi:Tol biopolymer transport system component